MGDRRAEDAKDCSPCQQLWDFMKQADEQQLERIGAHLREHFMKEENPAKEKAA